jgi:DNA-binding transcriptional LysR family regulator
MELRLLASFVAVAEELHFGRAARRLHLSQPPLSTQIMKLEDELAARLFDRSSRRVRLTEAGQALLVRARYLLAEADRTRAEIGRIAVGQSGRLSIGYTPTATYEVLPPALEAFSREHPEVQLELHEMTSPAQVLALREFRIELGFACLPVDSRDLEARVLKEDGLVVALPRGHRLARGNGSVRLGDLGPEPFVAVDESVEPGWARACDVAVRRAGLHPRVVQQTDTKIALLGLVAAGVGVALVSRSMAVLGRRDVVLRPLMGLRVRLPLGLLCRPSISPRARSLMQLSARAAGSDRRPQRRP